MMHLVNGFLRYVVYLTRLEGTLAVNMLVLCNMFLIFVAFSCRLLFKNWMVRVRCTRLSTTTQLMILLCIVIISNCPYHFIPIAVELLDGLSRSNTQLIRKPPLICFLFHWIQRKMRQFSILELMSDFHHTTYQYLAGFIIKSHRKPKYRNEKYMLDGKIPHTSYNKTSFD